MGVAPFRQHLENNLPKEKDCENRNWDVHGTIIAKKKSQQIEKDEIKIQQHRQDLQRQIETLYQREARLEALGFSSTIASQGSNWLPGLPFPKWDIGPEPIHLVVDVKQKVEAVTPLDPTTSSLSQGVEKSPPRTPASESGLSSLPTSPSTPAGRRTKHIGALSRAVARDFHAPI